MATTHGGRRSGAGRPPGGISQARRLIESALRRGMADALRRRGAEGSDELLAVAAAAQVVESMMLAGQGDKVLALWASVALKEGPGAQAEAPSADGLAGWLARAPGAPGGPDSARLPATVDAEQATARVFEGGPGDSQSHGRHDTQPGRALEGGGDGIAIGAGALPDAPLPGQAPLPMAPPQAPGALAREGARADARPPGPAGTPTPPARASARPPPPPHADF